MKLQIDSRMRLSDLRQVFRKHYPYLQPELLPEPAAREAGGRNEPDLPLGRLAGREFTGEVLIDRKSTIASVEESLQRLSGIGIQILRRGPFYWENILHKECHCLEQQNHMGKVVTRGMYEPDLL
ncbi:hypothetical protein EPD60_01305 [Flaviaesturariibacter flavus]|uniref:Uncharacterized protein n=1 Tax=Flaviaesturariibacter flavus TaxID=2502780 RepID=A0A4V2NWX6_9BACT|nr:hypothetical protein [Flaviaesturariibacter flavus]TCJ19082.1 hypothetical protein EPD60_01305 [Flaviaesturariibacter flavus]